MDLFSKRTTATTLEGLKEEWKDCEACPFHVQRKQVVFGVGEIGATVLAVGQSPADKEDELGLPFVGKGGVVTKNEFNKVGIPESDIWWTNALACRMFAHMTAIRDAFMKNCWDRLEGEILIVKPKMIVALGGPAAKRFLPLGSKGEMRGRTFEYRGIPGLTILHPAALNRRGAGKRNKEKIRADLDDDMVRVSKLYEKVRAQK